ncbi:hypothetical protein ID866_9915 [Astraeus odoratus]|nr:hypothetical protein ID866_9915 [Astraeus odoratus]
MSNIRDVLMQLHLKGYVHGDVRDVNTLVSKSDKQKFMLIDFDWAGEIGKVRYPMNVRRAIDLWRPSGAVDGALIMPEHDMDMLDEMQRHYGIVRTEYDMAM